MQILFRPNSTRILCGVAAGLAERYGFRRWLVRLIWITAFLVTPYASLAYLVLAVSMPSEYRFASQLELGNSGVPGTGIARFHKAAKLLTDRLLPSRSASSNTVAVLLLLFGALLELPNIEGVNFYSFHPIVTAISVNAASIASPFFYLSLAALLWFLPGERSAPVLMTLPIRPTFGLERNDLKMIGGVAAGLAEVLEIDPAYVRSALILLNFYTIGIAGAAYLVVWSMQRKQTALGRAERSEYSISFANISAVRSALIVALLLFVLFTALSQFRIYFFNTVLLQSVAFLGVGIFAVWTGLREERSREKVWVLFGSLVFLTGIYQLATNIASIHLTLPGRFEITEIIVAIALGYYALSVLAAGSRKTGLILTLALAVSAALISLNIVPPRYLAELDHFYGFFYPIIFAAIALWVVFER